MGSPAVDKVPLFCYTIRIMRNRRLIIIASLVFVSICAAGAAVAQPDLGPATRETDRAASDATTRKITNALRRPRAVSISIDTSDSPRAPDDGRAFFVKEIRFTGMRRFTSRDFTDITERYTNRELSSPDMNRLAKDIEMEYLRRGLVSVVFVPPQDIRDDTLMIQVMEPDAD